MSAINLSWEHLFTGSFTQKQQSEHLPTTKQEYDDLVSRCNSLYDYVGIKRCDRCRKPRHTFVYRAKSEKAFSITAPYDTINALIYELRDGKVSGKLKDKFSKYHHHVVGATRAEELEQGVWQIIATLYSDVSNQVLARSSHIITKGDKDRLDVKYLIETILCPCCIIRAIDEDLDKNVYYEQEATRQ